MRRRTASAFAAFFGVVLFAAAAAPWFTWRPPESPEITRETPLDVVARVERGADRPRGRPWYVFWGPGGSLLLYVLSSSLVGTVAAALAAVRGPREEGFHGVAVLAALAFGLATLLSALRLAIGASWLAVSGWGPITTGSLVLALVTAAAATAFATVASIEPVRPAKVLR